MAQSSEPDLAPSPPGLENVSTQDRTEVALVRVRDTAEDIFAERLSNLGVCASEREGMQSIREAVLLEVDSRVTEKLDEIWQKGWQMIQRMQQRHREKATELTDELEGYQARVQHLESDNQKLKHALAKLDHHVIQLGSVFSGARSAGLTEVSDVSSSHVLVGSPARIFPEAASGQPHLADVPPFPFTTGSSLPSILGPAAPQLSLVAALGGQQAPLRTPLLLAETLRAAPAMPSADASAIDGLSDSSNGQSSGFLSFSFTIRKADGMDLGLNVKPDGNASVLHVEGIRPEGAVEAWNRQCSGSATSAEKAVRPGDKIVSVNDVSDDADKMLEECIEKRLLKLTVSRALTNGVTPLRAEASVFVPMRQCPPESDDTANGE